MSVMHIVAEPITIHGKLIDVHWDEEAGTVTGQGAEHIMELATWGDVTRGYSGFASYKLSSDPLRNRVDMAVIIARFHRLPEVLRPYYPQPKWKRPRPGDIEVTY